MEIGSRNSFLFCYFLFLISYLLSLISYSSFLIDPTDPALPVLYPLLLLTLPSSRLKEKGIKRINKVKAQAGSVVWLITFLPFPLPIYPTLVNSTSGFGHSRWKTGHPVRSAIHKPPYDRAVLEWVTIWEFRVLNLFVFFLILVCRE